MLQGRRIKLLHLDDERASSGEKKLNLTHGKGRGGFIISDLN
jgi:hypothetical protein